MSFSVADRQREAWCDTPGIDSASDSALGTESSHGRSPISAIGLPWPQDRNTDEPVAVIGMACRFAGANSPSKLWDMVSSGRTGHSAVPERSWSSEAWYHPSRHRAGGICATSGHFLDDVSGFDAPFFSITANEAAAMDPMQRLGLEIAYEAFENAGIPMQKLAKSTTAVYSGVMTNDYQMLAEADPYRLGVNSAAGTGRAMLSNRISWFFDLQGPSLTIDTACSSSLYAVHLACQSIRMGESDQTLVTGQNLILNPTLYSQLSGMHMTSPDGISHSFDASANGYGRGEGIAGLVLKRLSSALADGDVIRAVIRATGVNSDGKTPGITVPSEDAQAELIRRVYERANLDMARTAYFEAHGTGTPKGDPIEVRAIRATIAAARKLHDVGPLYVGSVKPNIGHTEGCAGLAGLIKAVLCLESGVIPPVAGLRTINPELLEPGSDLTFPTAATPWPSTELRRASINSFGFGGANAHVVLDDARHYLEESQSNGRHITRAADEVTISCEHRTTKPALNDEDNDEAEVCQMLFVLSSFDRKGLGRNAKALGAFLAEHKTTSLTSLAHILAVKRTAHTFRSFAIAGTREELVSRLLTGKDNPAPPVELRSSQNRRLVFLFTGQGAQRPGMAKELLASCPVFRASIASSQKYLRRLGCVWDLADVLVYAKAETLNDARYSQPVCTAVQIALVQLLRHWGVVPSAVIGHSSGELTAAFAAGAVSHEDAMRVAYYRGFLATKVCSLVGRPGAMLAVGMSEKDASRFLAENWLDHDVMVACVNSPSSVTLSGPSTAISQAEEAFCKAGHFARALRTGGVAYHSPDMKVVGDEFIRCLGPLRSSRNRCLQVPMYSSVTESRVTDAGTLTAAYWHENMTSPVRFAGAMHNLLLSLRDPNTPESSPGLQDCTVLEIGPAKALAGPVGQIMSNMDVSQRPESIRYLSMLSAKEDSCLSTLTAAGMLWSIGVPIDLDKANDLTSLDHQLQLSELPLLPSYAWNHDKSYWHDAMPALVGIQGDNTPRIDLLGVPKLPRNPFEPAWQNVVRTNELPWLADHVVDGAALFPAAGYLAMAIEAVRSLGRERNQAFHGIELLDVKFENSLVVSKDTEDVNQKGQSIALTLKPDAHDDWVFEFAVYAVSPVAEQWRRLAVGTVVGIIAEKTVENEPAGFEQQERERQWHDEQRPRLENIKKAAKKHVDVEAFYAHLASIGLEYGPTFRGLHSIRCATDIEPQGHSKAFGECVVPDSRSVMPESYEHDYLIHPATLDSLFQLVFAALQSDSHGEMKLAAVPVSVRRVFVANTVPRISGARLAGTAASKRLVDGESESEHGVTTFSGDLTFCDAGFDRPAVLVEDILLRQILSPTSSNPADGEREVDHAEDSSFYRTAQMVWKEDIDQPFSRWRDRILQESSLTARAAFILDRVCHKRAHAKILCLGLDDSWDAFHGQDDSCMAKPENCTFFNTFQDWEDKLGSQSQQSPAFNKYDLVFLNSSALVEEEPRVRKRVPQYDRILSELAEMCVTDAWFTIIGNDKSNKAVANQLPEALVKLSGCKIILLSESSIDLLSGHDNVALAGPRPRGAPGTAGELGEARLLPKLCQDGVLIIGPKDDGKPTHSSAGFRDNTREMLMNSFSSLGIKSCYMPLDEAVAAPGKLGNRPIVSLVEVGASFVYNWSSKELEQFRTLVSSVSCILWLTTGGFLAPSSETMLQYAPIVGLLRTIRAEFPDLAIPLLDFSTHDRPEEAANMILEVLHNNLIHLERESGSQIGSLGKQTMPESEVSELDGRLFIPRVLAHGESDRFIASETSTRQPVQLTPAGKCKLKDIGVSVQESPELWVRAGDSQGKAYWVTRDHEKSNPLDARNSSIRLQYAVTHTDDLVETVHESPYKAVMAQQTLGVVETLAEGRNKDIFDNVVSPGDVVFGITHTPVRPMFFQDMDSLVRVPDSLMKSSAAVAYWLFPLSTAFYILSEAAHISSGESLLIDVGNDTVLQESLVQVSKCLGVRKVFICADEPSPESDSSVNDSAVRLPRLSLTSASLIRQATGGVSVVISTLNNLGNIRRFQMVSTDGVRVVGVNRSRQNEALKSSPFLKRVTQLIDLHDTVVFDLKHNLPFRTALWTVLRWMELGRITVAQPLRQLSTADKALVKPFTSDAVSPGRGATKRVLLSLTASDVVMFHRLISTPTMHLNSHGKTLDPEGTYIISGGLGALGLPLANMLCDLGARRLILLSRSGKPTTTDAVSALKELAARGCYAEIARCDITSKDHVEMLAEQLKKRQGFRLRGVIQSAMVLADSTFSNMTMDQWRTATGPKIQGSWNLHNLATHLDDREGGAGLDFFILLSSVSGVIGNSAQANYCAGNTFEDALAHFRRANGFPATSLNIGLVSDSSHFGKGTMESYSNVEKYLAMFGHLAPVTVTTQEVMASVKMVVTQSMSISSRSTTCDGGPAQLIVGISNRIPRHEDLLNRWPMDRKFDHRASSSVARGSSNGVGRQSSGKSKIDEMMASAKDIDQARRFVEEVVKEKVAQATGMEPDSIDAERSLLAYGIDSLKATEVRNWVKKNFKSELSVFDILSPAPISTLSAMITTRSKMFDVFRDSKDASVVTC